MKNRIAALAPNLDWILRPVIGREYDSELGGYVLYPLPAPPPIPSIAERERALYEKAMAGE